MPRSITGSTATTCVRWSGRLLLLSGSKLGELFPKVGVLQLGGDGPALAFLTGVTLIAVLTFGTQ